MKAKLGMMACILGFGGNGTMKVVERPFLESSECRRARESNECIRRTAKRLLRLVKRLNGLGRTLRSRKIKDQLTPSFGVVWLQFTDTAKIYNRAVNLATNAQHPGSIGQHFRVIGTIRQQLVV